VSGPLLTATNLYCERDRRILFESLSFAVHEGELMQIVGANGSGKTTLLRILAGLSDSYEGELLWQGESFTSHRYDRSLAVQYLGHSGGINEMLTPLENLRWYAALQGQEVAPEQVENALSAVGLRGFEENACYSLSAGQKRRVNLARLQLLPARLWILDEPFTSLDARGVAVIEAMIAEQLASGGSVILTTHQQLTRFTDLRQIVLGAKAA